MSQEAFLKSAAQAAHAGDWPKARRIWEQEEYKARLPTGLMWIVSGLAPAEERLRFLRSVNLVMAPALEPRRVGPQSTLAVLLLNNATNDLSVPGQMRNALAAEAQRWGHRALPLADVDENLRRKGFTDGGQLGAASARDLGRWVGAEFLVMGEIERVTPQAALKLVHAASGETVFEKTVSGFRHFAALETFEERKERDRRKKEAAQANPRNREEAPAKNAQPALDPGPVESSVTAARKFFRPWPRELDGKSDRLK